jgi:hypothetical protein
MSIRLNKVTRDFNVGLSTIVEFLCKKGLSIEESPNTKISDEEYELLIKEFSKDKDTQPESVIIDKKKPLKNEEQSEAAEKIFKIEVPIIKPNIKITGHIDLPPINQATHPKKKSNEEKPPRKRIRAKQINFSEEKDPMFVGDIPAFKKWVNLQYSDALDPYITENVVVIDVYFNVDEKGHVKDVKAHNAKHPILAAEAIRIVSLSPNWIPGIKNGIPTEVSQLYYLKFNRFEDDNNENETDSHFI